MAQVCPFLGLFSQILILLGMDEKKAFLVILDGWGHGETPDVSAINQANTPFVDSLYEQYPNAELVTYGYEVGLPEGQMGNSEVGHLNLGAGRVVYQELARINKAIEEGTLEKNEVLIEAINYAKENNKAIHLLGLVSDGGVHSHINHLKALSNIINQHSIPTYVNAFLDGRDTAPDSGYGFIKELLEHIEGTSVRLSSIIGRYYAMDRDKRWERIQKAYDLLLHGIGTPSDNALDAIKESYSEGLTDEFMEPIKLLNLGEGLIKPEDVVIFFNFRTDRPRQLTEVLTQKEHPAFGMNPLNLEFYTMTEYKEDFNNIKVIYRKDTIKNTIGEVLAKNGKTQLRAAETEKYPHVTFFFSGGEEKVFEGEKRILVNSPKVATYDLQPEMSAIELKDLVIDAIIHDSPDFVCLNFANADMVGHTGIMEAAIKACETVDNCLSEIVPIALELNYDLIIIADHGNADIMTNPDGSAHTAHTTNPVPVIYVSKDSRFKNIQDGKLADIVPTILKIMGLHLADEMTGNVLLS